MINVFTVLTVNTQQSENVGREPRRCMPQLNLGWHADHAAVLRLCTGVDWHHQHLVSEHKYPEIYSYYFTGSYSLDYSTVRYSPLHYLLLLLLKTVCLMMLMMNRARCTLRKLCISKMHNNLSDCNSFFLAVYIICIS